MENAFGYDATQEPLVFYPSTIELLFATESPSDAISLYCIYYGASKWEEFRSIEEMDKYALGTIKNPLRFQKAKKTLLNLHLIQEMYAIDEETSTPYNYIYVHLFPY